MNLNIKMNSVSESLPTDQGKVLVITSYNQVTFAWYYDGKWIECGTNEPLRSEVFFWGRVNIGAQP